MTSAADGVGERAVLAAALAVRVYRECDDDAVVAAAQALSPVPTKVVTRWCTAKHAHRDAAHYSRLLDEDAVPGRMLRDFGGDAPRHAAWKHRVQLALRADMAALDEQKPPSRRSAPIPSPSRFVPPNADEAWWAVATQRSPNTPLLHSVLARRWYVPPPLVAAAALLNAPRDALLVRLEALTATCARGQWRAMPLWAEARVREALLKVAPTVRCDLNGDSPRFAAAVKSYLRLAQAVRTAHAALGTTLPPTNLEKLADVRFDRLVQAVEGDARDLAAAICGDAEADLPEALTARLVQLLLRRLDITPTPASVQLTVATDTYRACLAAHLTPDITRLDRAIGAWSEYTEPLVSETWVDRMVAADAMTEGKDISTSVVDLFSALHQHVAATTLQLKLPLAQQYRLAVRVARMVTRAITRYADAMQLALVADLVPVDDDDDDNDDDKDHSPIQGNGSGEWAQDTLATAPRSTGLLAKWRRALLSASDKNSEHVAMHIVKHVRAPRLPSEWASVRINNLCAVQQRMPTLERVLPADPVDVAYKPGQSTVVRITVTSGLAGDATVMVDGEPRGVLWCGSPGVLIECSGPRTVHLTAAAESAVLAIPIDPARQSTDAWHTWGAIKIRVTTTQDERAHVPFLFGRAAAHVRAHLDGAQLVVANRTARWIQTYLVQLAKQYKQMPTPAGTRGGAKTTLEHIEAALAPLLAHLDHALAWAGALDEQVRPTQLAHMWQAVLRAVEFPLTGRRTKRGQWKPPDAKQTAAIARALTLLYDFFHVGGEGLDEATMQAQGAYTRVRTLCDAMHLATDDLSALHLQALGEYLVAKVDANDNGDKRFPIDADDEPAMYASLAHVHSRDSADLTEKSLHAMSPARAAALARLDAAWTLLKLRAPSDRDARDYVAHQNDAVAQLGAAPMSVAGAAAALIPRSTAGSRQESHTPQSNPATPTPPSAVIDLAPAVEPPPSPRRRSSSSKASSNNAKTNASAATGSARLVSPSSIVSQQLMARALPTPPPSATPFLAPPMPYVRTPSNKSSVSSSSSADEDIVVTLASLGPPSGPLPAPIPPKVPVYTPSGDSVAVPTIQHRLAPTIGPPMPPKPLLAPPFREPRERRRTPPQAPLPRRTPPISPHAFQQQHTPQPSPQPGLPSKSPASQSRGGAMHLSPPSPRSRRTSTSTQGTSSVLSSLGSMTLARADEG